MPESETTTHNYLFCQFIYPESGHDGGPCDCYHTPSQKRISRAKARLARLRANKGRITRASTSDIPESTVASDPAVTKRMYNPESKPTSARMGRAKVYRRATMPW